MSITENINIFNVKNTYAGDLDLTGFFRCNNIINCSLTSSTAVSTLANKYAYLYGIRECDRITSCKVDDLNSVVISGAGAFVDGYNDCEQVNNCTSLSLSQTNGDATSSLVGFNFCKKITNCLSNNSGTYTYGFITCKSVQQCMSINNNTAYHLSHADASGAQACADTAAGGYNS